jgi:uncharacterized membrane protein YeiH
VAALIGMRLAHTIARLNPLWVMLDALTVGLYAAIGMTKALGVGLPLLLASLSESRQQSADRRCATCCSDNPSPC